MCRPVGVVVVIWPCLLCYLQSRIWMRRRNAFLCNRICNHVMCTGRVGVISVFLFLLTKCTTICLSRWCKMLLSPRPPLFPAYLLPFTSQPKVRRIHMSGQHCDHEPISIPKSKPDLTIILSYGVFWSRVK